MAAKQVHATTIRKTCSFLWFVTQYSKGILSTQVLHFFTAHRQAPRDAHACDIHKITLDLIHSSLVAEVQLEAHLAGVLTLEALPKALPAASSLLFVAVAGKRVKWKLGGCSPDSDSGLRGPDAPTKPCSGVMPCCSCHPSNSGLIVSSAGG